MPPHILASFGIGVLFALIHMAGRKLDFLQTVPRSIWLSAAGGVSVAYVFVHLLPELAEHQERVGEEMGGTGLSIYLAALVGLMIFYGLDRMLRRTARRDKEHPTGIFWTHVGAFAVYNFIIGHLLVQQEERSLQELLLYGAALGVHFIVNDQALRQDHGRLYDRYARWLLALAPLAGWTVGLMTQISQDALSALFALLAGSVVLNVLKEELPEDRESRFSAFAAGAAAYAGLLMLI